MLTDDNSSAVVLYIYKAVVQEARVSFGIARCTMQVCCFHPNALYRCEGKSRRMGEGGGRQQTRQDGERRETDTHSNSFL
jgi:hypothetical protein